MAARVSPVKVTAIVYSAKALKPKKKDKHRFAVIFGSGQNKFRTDIVEDLFDNPTFNTECEIPIDDVNQPLTFVVTEKSEKDVLGQVVVPLGDLVTFRTNHTERVPLRAHKKCQHPQGELLFEAWISSGSVAGLGLPTTIEEEVETKSSVTSGLKKLRDKLAHSPMLMRKSGGSVSGHQRNSSDELSTKPNSSSFSCQDLSTLSVYKPSASPVVSSPKRSSVFSATNDAGSLSSLDSISDTVVVVKPEVTGISPKEGPIEGGTRLTIRGANLGRNKEDVVGLFVCGSNILSTLEYVSPSKLMCTTKAHRSGAGSVIIETQSGGRGVSLVQFTFLGAATTVQDTSDTISEASSSLSRSSSRGDADIKRDGSFKGASDKDASGLASVKSSLKARSMFDLSLMPKLAPPTRPEVTGVSPCDGPALSSTRLVIRGKNLGRSRADIILVTVAGVDCTESVEYDSSSRLTCFAGPTPGGALSHGDVIVETKSGGIGESTVQFRFTHSAQEENEYAAIPYEFKSESAPIALAAIPPTVTAGETVHSIPSITAAAVSQVHSMSSSPITVTAVRQPPPIVEIQPMSRDNNRKAIPSSPQRKVLAPLPNPVISTVSDNYNNKEDFNGGKVTNQILIDNELRAKLTELSKQLTETGDQVKTLQSENKLLKDENERIRLYMESLVSRAIAVCPQILCVDS